MKEQISNCCKAYVSINTVDEGTSFYVCHSCGRSCDLFNEMKEHVRGDNCHRDDGETVLVSRCTLNRLKRLDDNLRKSIKELDDALANEFAACFESKTMQMVKEILEGLLK